MEPRQKHKLGPVQNWVFILFDMRHTKRFLPRLGLGRGERLLRENEPGLTGARKHLIDPTLREFWQKELGFEFLSTTVPENILLRLLR